VRVGRFESWKVEPSNAKIFRRLLFAKVRKDMSVAERYEYLCVPTIRDAN